MTALAVLLGLFIGFGILSFALNRFNLIMKKKRQRDFEDNGGRNTAFYTPKTTTELLREFGHQFSEGKISQSTYERRRKKTLKKFREFYNVKLGFDAEMVLGTEDAVEHLKQLKIMQTERLVTDKEYQDFYELYVKRLKRLGL